jgi:hypothetical protein
MGGERLTKKGRLVQTEEGQLILLNDEGKAYLVSEVIAYIWNAFEDRTVEEVTQQLSTVVNEELEELRGPVEQVASQLKAAGLLA